MRETRIILLVLLLFGCNTYTIKEGQPYAILNVHAPNLEDDGGKPYSVQVKMHEQSNEIGYFSVTFRGGSSGVFRIPLVNNMRLEIVAYISFFMGPGHCRSEVSFSPEQARTYDLTSTQDMTTETCAVVLKNSSGETLAEASGKVGQVNLIVPAASY